MAHAYATQMEGARAVGRDMPISAKHSLEICKFIKGKNLQAAKKILGEVMKIKTPVPYTRHNFDLGHKPGIGPARYPVKASEWILKVLNSVEMNAQAKGMNVSQLRVSHIVTHVASRPRHGGRHRGRRMKRTHVEIIVQESKEEKKEVKQVRKAAGKTGEQK